MNPFQHLNLAIRQLRKRAGLSQRASVDMIRANTGSSLNTMMVSRWERGERSPSVDSLGAFLWGLGYSLRDLCDALEASSVKAGTPTDWWRETLKQLEVDEESRLEAVRKLRAELLPPAKPKKRQRKPKTRAAAQGSTRKS